MSEVLVNSLELRSGVRLDNKLTDQQIRKGYEIWLRYYDHEIADLRVRPFLNSTVFGEWLRLARRALFLSSATMAKRMQISQAAYCKLETHEKLGKISIAKLQLAAEALGCELVYAMRPKSKILFSELVWKQIYHEAKGHAQIFVSHEGRKPLALSGIAKFKMRQNEVRKRLGWCRLPKR